MAIHLPSILYIPVTLLLLPVIGTLVRVRVAYKPKPPPTLEDDRPYEGGSIFAREESKLWVHTVIKATRRIEGWQGLFRGLVPAFLTGVVFSWNFAIRATFWPAWTSREYDLVDAALLSTLLLLPQVWVYRTIATPTKLKIFRTNIFDALSAIFSPYERSRLLLPIFLTPGLILAIVLNIAFQMHVFKPIRKILETPEAPGFSQFSAWSVQSEVLSFVFLATLVCAPLDVIITRLAVQKTVKTSPIINHLIAAWKSLNLFHRMLVGLVGVADLAMFIWTLIDYNVRYEIWMQTVPAGVTFLVAMYLFFITRGAVAGHGSGVHTKVESLNNDEVMEGHTEKSHPILDIDLLPSPATSVVEEHVIELRGDDKEPYTGVYDCATKIISEEGFSALYRGWWATFISLYCLSA